MEYICHNCNILITLPEIINTPREVTCGLCNSELNLEFYKKCNKCNFYFLKHTDSCNYCSHNPGEMYTLDDFEFVYVKDTQTYKEAIHYLNNLDIIALDTEGNSLDPYANDLLLVQLGDENRVYIFNFRYFDRLVKESFWKKRKSFFIMHNAKYDLKVLKHSLGIEIKNVFDTMLAERIITCGKYRRNSLKAIAAKYFDLELNKKIVTDFLEITPDNFDKKISKELVEYSANDVAVLIPIYKKQRWILDEEGLYKTAKLEFDVVKVVAEMELNGIYVNIKEWQKLIDRNQFHRENIEDQIHNFLIDKGFEKGLFGDIKINLNSAKDLLKVFTKLKINLDSTGDSELAKVDSPLSNLIREYRKFEKQLSSFGESFLKLVKKNTSRVHPNFNQVGADTGRFSCNNPNLQQIPSSEEYRKCFSAPKGRKIVTCDYSQQELRVLASLSGDPKFIKFYEEGVDLHSATASMMFNIPIEKVDKEKHRKVAKTINFGLAYGQGPGKLGQTIGTDKEGAQKMIKKYFSQFSFIGSWLENAAKSAAKVGYSVTLLGRKRYYKLPKQFDTDFSEKIASIGRRGKNSPIQGSSADMIKLALVKIHKELKEKKLDAFLINIVHDEIVVEASKKDAKQAAQIVESCMIEAGKEIAPNVPILAEGGVSDYWTH